jgi:hypothetical protein
MHPVALRCIGFKGLIPDPRPHRLKNNQMLREFLNTRLKSENSFATVYRFSPPCNLTHQRPKGYADMAAKKGPPPNRATERACVNRG